MMKIQDKLIVALDVSDLEQAKELVEQLYPAAKIFKVGSQLFTSCGPRVIDMIHEIGAKVFLDLKFHDIPNIVARAAAQATRLGVYMFDLHTQGGFKMMQEAAKASKGEAKRLNIALPLILGVTVLTSMDSRQLAEVFLNEDVETQDVETQVVHLAKLARKAGLNGVIASAKEVKAIRACVSPDFLIAVPGVRPSWSEVDDQKRVATPKQAISDGADYIIIGRPITQAKSPRRAAEKILAEIGEIGVRS